jgi:MFS family permease
VTSLDSNTTQVLVPYATSSFNTHSLLSVIGIVSGVMIAVVKAPMAKIGDVFGRMEAFLLSVLLYVVGYIQMAASHNVETYAVVPTMHRT